MTDAETADAAVDLAETLIMAVPDGTTNLAATMAMAVALGVSLYHSPVADREKAVNIMCDIVRQTARGERMN